MVRTQIAGVISGVALMGACVLPAAAAYNISLGASAPTYGTTLNFDEVGGPTGSLPFADQPWTSLGLTLTSGEGSRVINNFSTTPGFNWLPNNNAMWAPYGATFAFDAPVTEFSAQYWDSSGPATFTGGGAVAVLYSGATKVGFLQIQNPAYGGVGNSWVNVTTTGGSTFDSVSLFGFGFFPEAYVDNISWNAIPSPGATGLLALAGFAGLRRRRN